MSTTITITVEHEDGADGCACEFDPYELDDGTTDAEDSWHYRRTCGGCGFSDWWSLHCPHDGIQNPCPECRWVQPGGQSPMQNLGLAP